MGIDGLVDKHTRQWREMLGILGSEITASAALAALALNLGVALQVVCEAVGHDGALLDDVYPLGHVFVDFVDKQRVVGAAQDYRIDIRALGHQQVNVFFHKIVGAIAVTLAVLDQWHPHGAGMAMHLAVRVHSLNLDVVAAASDSAWRAKDPDVSRVGQLTHLLDGGAHNAQHAPLGGEGGEVLLLDRAQRLGRGGVAGQDNQVAPLGKQVLDRLQCEFIDQFA